MKRRRFFWLSRPRVLGWLTLCVSVVVALVGFPGATTLNAGQRPKTFVKTITADASPAQIDVNRGVLNPPAQSTYKGFTTREFVGANGATMTYYLYTPPAADMTPGVKLPLTLLLIGTGERASPTATPELNRARVLGDPYVNMWTSATVQQKWPGYILVPQVAIPGRWVNAPQGAGTVQFSAQPTTELALVKEILDQTIQEAGTTVDRNRVYITGISMGAYGVWDAIERWPTTFAAAAPISGAGDPSLAGLLVNIPIWDFHGSGDKTVPISGSTDMIQAIEAAGGNPKFTLIPSTSHDIWVKAYNYPGFLPWLYAQRA